MNTNVIEELLVDVVGKLGQDCMDMCRLTCIAHLRVEDYKAAWKAIQSATAKKVAVSFIEVEQDDDRAPHKMHRSVILHARDLTESWLADNPENGE